MDSESQIQLLLEKLNMLREQMPETPLDAEKKAMDIGLLEEQLAELYEQSGRKIAEVKDESLNDLTEQIKSITDELMELEIKMLKAEMNNDDSEKVKYQMCADSLKARRQTLIDEVRTMNGQTREPAKDDLEARVEALEKEVSDLKTLIYQILTR